VSLRRNELLRGVLCVSPFRFASASSAASVSLFILLVLKRKPGPR
jgi:hypothetical protein